jgi:hypothetical protein
MVPCEDKYWDKKTIYNALNTLSLDAILCVVTNFDNVGAIIAIMKEGGFHYNICSFFPDKSNITTSVDPYILVCVSKIKNKFFAPTLIMMDEPLEQMLLLSSTCPQDTVLVIGDKLYQVAMLAKRTCRHVVCFLEHYSEFLENEGIKMEEIHRAS